MNYICHHIDNDGYLGGSIILKYLLANNIQEEDTKAIPVNYGFTFDFIDELKEDDTVFIVDFSFEPEVMKKIISKVGVDNIYWIDHHDSAIKKYKDSDINTDMIKGLRSREAAGCELAYMYLCLLKDKSEVDGPKVDRFVREKRYSGELPYVVNIIGDWDTWTFKYGHDTRAFNAGLKLKRTNKLKFWFTFYDIYYSEGYNISPAMRDVMDLGNIIIEYEYNLYSKYCKQITTFTDKKNRKWALMNGITHTSKVFDPIEGEEQFDVMCIFHRCDTYWTYSLYSKKLDVRNISVDGYYAEGHPGAAGFQADHCIFDTIKIEEIIAKIE